VPRRTLELLPDALSELLGAHQWYETRSPSAAVAFFVEIGAGLARIRTNPLRGTMLPGGMRRFRLRRFPFVIVYLSEEDRVVVLAIAHTSRLPGYWRLRTSE